MLEEYKEIKDKVLDRALDIADIFSEVDENRDWWCPPDCVPQILITSAGVEFFYDYRGWEEYEDTTASYRIPHNLFESGSIEELSEYAKKRVAETKRRYSSENLSRLLILMSEYQDFLTWMEDKEVDLEAVMNYNERMTVINEYLEDTL